METQREKVVYNITLQSEESEEVKVIDRLHHCHRQKLIQLPSFQFQYGRDQKKEALLRPVVVLCQAPIGKCTNDSRKVRHTAHDETPEMWQLLLSAVPQNRKLVQAKKS